jgi:hypothetical protein
MREAVGCVEECLKGNGTMQNIYSSFCVVVTLIDIFRFNGLWYRSRLEVGRAIGRIVGLRQNAGVLNGPKVLARPRYKIIFCVI